MRSIILTLVLALAFAPSVKAQPAPEPTPTTEPAPYDAAAPASAPETEPVAEEPEPAAVPEPPAATPPPPPPPLMITAGELTLRPRLQARIRYEGRINPYGNGVDLPDQHFITARARIGLDARWNAVRIVAEVQDVGNYGTVPGADDGSRFALHQGFIEVGTENAYARLGRQEVAIGEERFVGPLDWLMAARSFDALRVHLASGIVTFDGFASMMRPRATLTYTDAMGMPASVLTRGDYFAFAQLAIKPSDTFTLEAYTLYRHDGPLATAPLQTRDIVAPGVRVAGKIGERLSYTAELQTQMGNTQTTATNSEYHFAMSATGDVRYALPTYTLNVGGNYATGNHASNRFDENDNFFPTNHKFYGYADLFGLRNLIEGHLTAEFRPADMPVRFFGAFRTYGLDAPTGRWSNAGGATLGMSTIDPVNGMPTNDKRFMGAELDATFAWTAHQRLVLSGGYSIFIPGQGAENLGHDDVQHWFFLMLGADTQ